MRPSDDDTGGQSGYNEAVDVWSIGCLAGTLLTNAFLFPRERSSRSEHTDNGESPDLSVAFSLEFLDTSKDWQRMSRKCKSFIRGCAMVDDSQRLTVSQALQHPWVAHPGFAEEMRAEYARAIADWTPRANTNDLIEYVKDPLPPAKTPDTGYEARLHDEVRSHHFPSQMPPMPSQLRTLDASMHVGTSLQARLSPIDSSSRLLPKKATSYTSLTTSDNDHGRSTFGHSNKRHGEDEMTYLSIQDYAPPMIYPAATPRERTLPSQSTWDMQLAGVMDIDGRSEATSNKLPHKRARL
jgi:serine/threonine protein kinase